MRDRCLRFGHSLITLEAVQVLDLGQLHIVCTAGDV